MQTAGKLPPLLAMRAFEAAGRHLSLTTAGYELGVTQGAVSRQVRLLEDFLDVRLFVRKTRRIELTEAGRQYLMAAQRALAIINDATQRVAGSSPIHEITISAFPTMAYLWLMPRLGLFTTAHPDIEVRIITADPPVELQHGFIQARICVGRFPGNPYDELQPRTGYEITSSWEGVNADFLFEEYLVPVVSPRYIADKSLTLKVSDLNDLTLIHSVARRHAWPDWLKAKGYPGVRGHDDLHVAHLFIALQLALEGKGVAIVPKATLNSFERRNELVCPFEPDVKSAGEYYLLTHETDARKPHIRAFRNWLASEAEKIA